MGKKINIGVIFGGASHEKEISLESGRNIVYKLQKSTLYNPIPLFLSSNLVLYSILSADLVCHTTKEIEIALDDSRKVLWNNLGRVVDFVFIALHGGIGENGSLQGALAMLQIPYNGSGVLTSSLCMNKYKTNQFLSLSGFDVPKNCLISCNDSIDDSIAIVESKIAYPLIVKPHDDGCSVLVQKVVTREQLIAAVSLIWADGKKYALVEEYIHGMELTVGVIGNQNPQVLPPSYCVTSNGVLTIEDKFLPGAGENQTPAPISNEEAQFVQDQIKKVFITVDASGYARIDCFYQNSHVSTNGKKRLVILEINTLPGLTPATCIFHQAAEIGMRPLDFIEKIIQLGFEKHAIKTIKEEKNNIQGIDSFIKKTIDNKSISVVE